MKKRDAGAKDQLIRPWRQAKSQVRRERQQNRDHGVLQNHLTIITGDSSTTNTLAPWELGLPQFDEIGAVRSAPIEFLHRRSN